MPVFLYVFMFTSCLCAEFADFLPEIAPCGTTNVVLKTAKQSFLSCVPSRFIVKNLNFLI